MGFKVSNNLTTIEELAKHNEAMEIYETKFDAAMDILGYTGEDKAEVHMARDDASLCGNHMALKAIKLRYKNDKALKFLNDISSELESEYGKNSKYENALVPWSNVIEVMAGRVEEKMINKAMFSFGNQVLATYSNMYNYQRQS